MTQIIFCQDFNVITFGTEVTVTLNIIINTNKRFTCFLIKKIISLSHLDQYYNIDVPTRTARAVTTRSGQTLSKIWYNCP